MNEQIPSGHTSSGPQCHRCGLRFSQNPSQLFRLQTDIESGILFYRCIENTPEFGPVAPQRCRENDTIGSAEDTAAWWYCGEHSALQTRRNAQIAYYWLFSSERFDFLPRLSWLSMRS